MRIDNDWRAAAQPGQVLLQPAELILSKVAQPTGLQVEHIDQPDEVHAIVVETAPAAAGRALAVTLEKLLAMKPAVLIPGHGPVMRDDTFVRQEVALLASLKSQVEASVARGDALAQARKSVNLDEFKRQFAGSSQALGFIFDNYVASSGIAAAYRDATKRGTDLFSTDRR